MTRAAVATSGARKRGQALDQRDIDGFIATMDERVLNDIGEAAAHTPKRYRLGFASILRGMGEVYAEKTPGPGHPDIFRVDLRIREAMMRAFNGYVDIFPELRDRIATALVTAADLARDGRIPMGTKRLPRVPASGSTPPVADAE